MSRVEEDKVSVGKRCQEERDRLGLSRAAVAETCGKTPQAIGEYERGVSYPGSEALLGFVKLGMDTQYILTGVRSTNLFRVAEEAGTYRRSAKEPPTKKEINPEVLTGVIAGVDEYLADRHKKMSPEKKTELIMLLCDFFTAETAQNKPAVKEAVAKIIQLKIGGAR